MAKKLTYTGEKLQNRVSFVDSKGVNRELKAYIPSNELKQAVNIALYLKKRPLLLMGEPGCGKTRLAEAVAYELHGEKMHDHFFRWDIKSTTKAKEGIYEYDALRRLYDANLKEESKNIDIGKYIEKGVLAKAFIAPQNKDNEGNPLPNILLIDEIDKADIDFPNDLLLELSDAREFVIPELGEEGRFSATSEVIIFITSNRERELPEAFLRRCLFHFISFPKDKDLRRIIEKEFDISKEYETLITDALATFKKVRNDIPENEKKPSTAELLDWFGMIKYCKDLKNPNTEEKKLIEQLSHLGTDKIPFKQVLLKTYDTFIKNQEDAN